MTWKSKSPAQLQKEVEGFNRRFPIGSEVMLKKDGIPEPVRTRTASEAFILANHSCVIFLEGVSGSYLASHVSEAP
jgi:hypothetical protein